MEAVPDTLEEDLGPQTVSAAPLELVAPASTGRRQRLSELTRELRFPALTYGAALALLYVTALVNGALRNRHFTNELVNWDGVWYRAVATRGYLAHPALTQNRNGFFPLYPAMMSLLAHALGSTTTVAGIIISGIGGLIAALLVYQLALGWWGRPTARKAVALFCFFPGAVVFSMVYSEGLLLPLAAGCILALQRRRWLLAGVLAGLGTATEPDALVLVLVCAVAAGLELRRHGWRDRQARRSLIAPLLAPFGAIAFAGYMWTQTGTPLATYLAQKHGWHERTDLLAMVHLAERLADQISFTHFNEPTVNANYPMGLIGAAILIGGLVLLLRKPRVVSAPAVAWTLGIAFLALTSEYVPPNPRLLITAFPAVIVVAHYLGRRAFRWVMGLNVALLVFLSACTYIGVTLRP